MGGVACSSPTVLTSARSQVRGPAVHRARAGYKVPTEAMLCADVPSPARGNACVSLSISLAGFTFRGRLNVRVGREVVKLCPVRQEGRSGLFASN